MFLARKIARAKWEPKRDLSEGEISAEALTGDLRTTGNALSFWRCGTGMDRDIEEATLAIAAGGDRLDKIDIVWLADADLLADGQALSDSLGKTPVTEFADRHVDVRRLDFVRLGKIARRVVASIQAERFRRLAKRRVRELVTMAVEQGRIDTDRLSDGVRAEIRR